MTSFRFHRLLLVLLLVPTAAGCLTASAPETWNFRILYQENLQGFPFAPVGGIGFYGYHMWDNPGTVVGSATTLNGNTNFSGYVYSQNGRVPARWHLQVTSGHCTGQWGERNLVKDQTENAYCTVVRSGFYSTTSYGYLANWVPSEYWDVESGLATPSPGDPGTITGDTYLYVNDTVYSPNGRFRLEYQGDGNLVLYDGGTPLWATGLGHPYNLHTRVVCGSGPGAELHLNA